MRRADPAIRQERCVNALDAGKAEADSMLPCSMQQGTLTHAWTHAEASLPQGWALMGLVRGPAGDDEVDPVVPLWRGRAVRG